MVEMTKIETFLSSLDLPSIREQQNKDIMAFSRLKANKAPGSDGYPSKWYKSFKPQIIQKNMRAMLISLDAEKAFDSVGWEYLYRVLASFGFKEDFIKCIKTLYSSPAARIRVNGHLL